MDIKPWWQSRTLWVNALILLGTFLVNPDNELQKLGIPPVYAERAVAIGNMLLRLMTSAQLINRAV